MLKTNKSKWILTTIAFALVSIVLIAFGVKLNQQIPTRSLAFSDYSIGAINSSTGKNVESHKSLYTNGYHKVDGLEIKVNDNASITYKIAFYDEDKDFIEMSTTQSADFDNSDIPSGAEYFRVVITPNQVDGEDVTVTLLNIAKYANMLKITCNK